MRFQGAMKIVAMAETVAVLPIYPGHPSTVFLISGDESWYTYRLAWSGFSWLRAYPGPEPLSAKDDCPSEKWLWKDLLEETCEETPLKIRSRILEYEKPFYCRVCMFYFSIHSKSRQHNKVVQSQHFDINNYPDNTCTLCEYPYYNDANRKLHLESDEHKVSTLAFLLVTTCIITFFFIAAAAASVSHEIEASLVDPLNTSQEKEDATRNRTSEEPLWKETN
ncbi:hypothetical protein HID58_057465 [Brassica napus]|uniref:C2H2-type domain-containing protein n=1 Tax=Brassica napus TaxID=3708 RepID=A0ABQ8AR67_BRANA|nr:hypothetical protein HID58_057465 [Brassica napus]